MSKYGIYNNYTDFYNNLIIGNKIKYIKNDLITIIGTVIQIKKLGIKAIVIETNDKQKYLICNNEAHKCEVYDN